MNSANKLALVIFTVALFLAVTLSGFWAGFWTAEALATGAGLLLSSRARD